MNIRRTVLVVLAIVVVLAAAAWIAGGPHGVRAAAAAGAETGGDLEEFVPSEKVPADDAVAFPVDI